MKTATQPASKMVCLVVFGICVFACTTERTKQSPPVWFGDTASSSGIDFKHVSGAKGEFLLPEIMGSGVAIVDIDNDGDLDLYFIQGGQIDQNGEEITNELYTNDGTGKFSQVGSSGLESSAYGMGVTTGDYDDDGFVDLFVTNVGSNELFRNMGDGTFTNQTQAAQVAGGGFSTAAVFGDFDNDDDLDLFVSNYVEWTVASEKKCYDYGTGARNYCDPGNYARPSSDFLYRNNGDGTFTDVSESSGIVSSKGNGLGAIATDFNSDGLLDIYVANDKTPNHLWINQGDLKFMNEAFTRSAAMDDQGIAKAGMGVVAHDLDFDADMDIVVVNIQTETDSVYQNEGTYFQDATPRFGLTRSSRNFTRFGIVVDDFNLDGNYDIFQANGKVTYSPESAVGDVFAEENLLFSGKSDFSFERVPNYRLVVNDSIHTSRAAAKGDLNGDGLVDIVVTNRDARPNLLMNQQSMNSRRFTFNLYGINGSPDLHGRVSIPAASGSVYLGEVQVGGSYLAANSPTVHLTLPSNMEFLDVKIQWSGGVEESYNVPNSIRNLHFQRGVGLLEEPR